MRESGWEAFSLLRPALEQHRYTGVYQCTRRGILQLYGTDLDQLDRSRAEALDAAVSLRYSKLFGWYKTAMNRAHFSQLIRIVHPEFYAGDETRASAAEERSFTDTILRIDPFLELGNDDSPREDVVAEARFVAKLFGLAA